MTRPLRDFIVSELIRVEIDDALRLDTQQGQLVALRKIPYRIKRRAKGFRYLREDRENNQRYAVFEVFRRDTNGNV